MKRCKKRKVLQNVQDSKIYIYPNNFIAHLLNKCQVLFDKTYASFIGKPKDIRLS